MAHPNEDLIRRGYEAFSRGDMQALDELLADDVVWHTAGRSSIAGDRRGKAEVFELFRMLAEGTNGTLKLEVHDVLANDEHGLGLFRLTAEREGRRIDDKGVNVFHITNGKVTEAWGHAGDQYAVDEFWG